MTRVGGDRRGRAGSWDWLGRAAAIHPDRAYWRSDRATFTLGALNARVGRVVGRLADRGIQPGDRVASLLAPDYQHVELLFAAIRLGAILVPLNPALTGEERAERLDSADPRLVVAPVALGDLRGRDLLVVPEAAPPDDELAAGVPSPVPYEPSADSVQCLMYTSGTSGRPKGAMLTLGQHRWAAWGSQRVLGHDPQDAWLLTLPLFHVGGQAILLRAVLAGARVVALPRFDAARAASHLADGTVTLASLVPTMLQRVLDVEAGRFSPRLRAVLIGGGRAEPALLERAWAAGMPVRSTYGMTETASQAATLEAQHAPAGLHTSGTPLWGVDVCIANPGPDGVGDIWVRGPQVIQGYWGERARDPEDWFATGDLGRMDDEGRLVVVDRRTDLIVSGGENVYPAEIERVVARHPGVRAVAVVGVSDAEWGQAAVAIVVPSEGSTLTVAGLTTFAQDHLARYKVPRRWIIAESLPLTANGKVWRARLRALVERGELA